MSLLLFFRPVALMLRLWRSLNIQAISYRGRDVWTLPRSGRRGVKKARFFHALPRKILLALVPGDFLSALSFLNPSYTMATSPSTFSSWGENQARFAKVQGFPYCLGIGVPLTTPHPFPGLLGLIHHL